MAPPAMKCVTESAAVKTPQTDFTVLISVFRKDLTLPWETSRVSIKEVAKSDQAVPIPPRNNSGDGEAPTPSLEKYIIEERLLIKTMKAINIRRVNAFFEKRVIVLFLPHSPGS